MIKNNPGVSVIIPTLGRPACLKECLESFVCQTNKDFEIVIVTGERETLLALAGDYPRLDIRVIEQEGRGLSNARNTGMSAAGGSYVSFIDDDVVVAPAWIEQLIQTFAVSSTVGGVSGPTIIAEDRIGQRDIMAFHARARGNVLWRLIHSFYLSAVLEHKQFAVGRIFKSGAFSMGANYLASAEMAECVEVDYLEACNMTFRKDILDRIGVFLPEYKGVGDWCEPDLAFRVRQAGYKLIFNPRARVDHRVSQSGVFKERGKDSAQRMINFIHFYFKWIRPDTLEKAARFGANVLFLNMYWIYKFVSTGSRYWLCGLWGTVAGLSREVYSNNAKRLV